MTLVTGEGPSPVYVDYNATTPVAPEVFAAMAPKVTTGSSGGRGSRDTPGVGASSFRLWSIRPSWRVRRLSKRLARRWS